MGEEDTACGQVDLRASGSSRAMATPSLQSPHWRAGGPQVYTGQLTEVGEGDGADDTLDGLDVEHGLLAEIGLDNDGDRALFGLVRAA